MTCVTRIDREAQKVISRSVLSCAIVALCIGVALLALWGIVYAIDRSFDVELIIISCAPICFAVVVYILYLRLLSQADGSNSFNVYDFGKTTFSVKATRRGAFAGALDLEYSQIKKVKTSKNYLLLHVRKLGAFVVDRRELGDYEKVLRADISACANT